MPPRRVRAWRQREFFAPRGAVGYNEAGRIFDECFCRPSCSAGGVRSFARLRIDRGEKGTLASVGRHACRWNYWIRSAVMETHFETRFRATGWDIENSEAPVEECVMASQATRNNNGVSILRGIFSPENHPVARTFSRIYSPICSCQFYEVSRNQRGPGTMTILAKIS